MHELDISVPLRPEMPVWGDERIEIEQTHAIADGDVVNMSRIAFCVHTGTHVDAPRHFVDGAPGLDEIPLSRWSGDALVVDATVAERRIDGELLRSLVPPGTERVLLKTRSAALWDRDRFSTDYVCLDSSGASAAVALGIRLAGIDYLTIGDEDAHRILFRAGIVALEGLDMRAVTPGPYRLTCLPLHLPGADGAPARAVLGPR